MTEVQNEPHRPFPCSVDREPVDAVGRVIGRVPLDDLDELAFSLLHERTQRFNVGAPRRRLCGEDLVDVAKCVGMQRCYRALEIEHG